MYEYPKEEPPKSISERIFGIIWRSIVIGFVYTFTTFFCGDLLAKQGMPFPDMAELGMSKSWFLGAAVLMGFVVGAISQIVHTSKPNHIMTWTVLLFLNPFSVTLESAFLAPEILKGPAIPALMLVQFTAALVAAIFITFLFASSSRQPFGSYFHRPWAAWGMRISISIGIALLLYCLLGTTDYRLIPELYYQNYQVRIAPPTVDVVFGIEFIRAILVVLSLVPMIITIGATKRFIAVICGISLVVLGSISPFLQVSNLSMFLLLASSGRIFLQNFLIGLFTGALLGYPSKMEAEGKSIVEFLRPILREALANNRDFFKELCRFHFKIPRQSSLPEEPHAESGEPEVKAGGGEVSQN